jgi:hypothetical protein
MPIRKTELKATAGVKLVQVETVTAAGKVTETHYRLSTLRPNQPRVIADPQEAEDAFDLEVMASLTDPVVQRLIP